MIALYNVWLPWCYITFSTASLNLPIPTTGMVMGFPSQFPPKSSLIIISSIDYDDNKTTFLHPSPVAGGKQEVSHPFLLRAG